MNFDFKIHEFIAENKISVNEIYNKKQDTNLMNVGGGKVCKITSVIFANYGTRRSEEKHITRVNKKSYKTNDILCVCMCDCGCTYYKINNKRKSAIKSETFPG